MAHDRSNEPDAVDPAQGVINWFAALMVCVLLGAGAVAGLIAWGLWLLARHFIGG